MDFSKKHQKVIQYLKRRYSTKASVFALGEPTFITYKRRATIFLGRDWKSGVRLSRSLKNRGYSVTLRVKPIPSYVAKDNPKTKAISYSPGRRALEDRRRKSQ